MYDDSRIAFGGALAAADLLTTDEAGVMQRAKLSTKIFAVVGRKEAPEVSEELRSLWRLRERCPNHTGPEKKRFTTLVQDVLDEVDLGQLAMLTRDGLFPASARQEPNLKTLWRALVRLAVIYYAALDSQFVYSTSVITKLASSVVLAERYEGSLALRAFHDKVTERDTSKPSEGKTKKLCFGCYKPECTETRFTCPVYLIRQFPQPSQIS